MARTLFILESMERVMEADISSAIEIIAMGKKYT